MAELIPFHNKDKITFKPKFVDRYSQLLGEERYKEFVEVSLSFMRRGIRVKTLKISVADLKKRIEDKWE